MNLTEEARRLLTCDELRGRVPDEVQKFLRVVAGLEPVTYMTVKPTWQPSVYVSQAVDGQYDKPAGKYPLYTLDCVATPGCKAATEKMEPRHDQP